MTSPVHSLPGADPDLRNNRYLHPHAGLAAPLLEAWLNHAGWARWRRSIMAKLPFLRMASEVHSVVYLNWLVPVQAAQVWLPPGLRLWQCDGLTPFTVLTYRHRHFGPEGLGPLRRICPSPAQSNWRFYLQPDATQQVPVRTVLFLKNLMDSLPYTVATRLFSDAMATHLAQTFRHECVGETWLTLIEGGEGSAPGLLSRGRPVATGVLPDAFKRCFGTWEDAVAFLCCQDAAISPCAQGDGLALAHIDLPIDLARVQPIALDKADCDLLRVLPPVGPALGFIVPEVHFRVLSETVMDPR